MSGDAKDFNRLRAQFSRRANAPEVPPLASKLCWVIAFKRMDIKRRSTFVTQKTLASDLGGVTVRSVQRMIDVLKPLGLNVAPGHGPDKASTYWIGDANTTSMSPIQPGQGDTGVAPRRHYSRQKATLVSPLLKKISKKGSKKSAAVPAARTSRDERESATNGNDAPPNQRAPDDGALIDPVADQQPPSAPPSARQPPPPAPPMGTAANGAVRDEAAALLSKILAAQPDIPIGDEEEVQRKLCGMVIGGERPDDVIRTLGEVLRRGAGGPTLATALKAVEADLAQEIPF
ncbi:hypothetical protein ACVWZM_002685 [Bradyrhizobium sp. USDA 4501]